MFTWTFTFGKLVTFFFGKFGNFGGHTPKISGVPVGKSSQGTTPRGEGGDVLRRQFSSGRGGGEPLPRSSELPASNRDRLAPVSSRSKCSGALRSSRYSASWRAARTRCSPPSWSTPTSPPPLGEGTDEGPKNNEVSILPPTNPPPPPRKVPTTVREKCGLMDVWFNVVFFCFPTDYTDQPPSSSLTSNPTYPNPTNAHPNPNPYPPYLTITSPNLTITL